jgi:hypothetical protein
MIGPRVTFELRCRVLACPAKCTVHATRTVDPRVPYLETSSLLAPAGWVVMHRARDSHALSVSALCSRHADIWDEPADDDAPPDPPGA